MSNTRPGVPPRPVPGGRAGDPRGGILPGDAGPAPPRQLPAALRLPALPPQHGQPAQQVPTDPHIFSLHLFICLSVYLSIYIYAPIYLPIYRYRPRDNILMAGTMDLATVTATQLGHSLHRGHSRAASVRPRSGPGQRTICEIIL